jgi:hypothetical protein
MEDSILKTLLTVGIAIFSAAMTAKFALRRFYTERWWEKKAETYSRIMEAAHNVKRYSELMLEVERKSRDMEEDRYEQLQSTRREAEDILARQLDVGGLVISKAAVLELQKLSDALADARNKDSSLLYLEQVLQALGAFLREFRILARKDLRV